MSASDASVGGAGRLQVSDHESFIVYRNFRWLKNAVFLSLIALILYIIDDPSPMPNGGTWLGYGLGTLGFGLILWLTWLGMRKRRMTEGAWSLKGWTSAHIYLGLSLIVIATLHTGFQFGWNVHTLAYGLMMAVIASGAFGMYAYARYPRLMAETKSGVAVADIARRIEDLDVEAERAALDLDDRYVKLVGQARAGETLAPGVWRRMRRAYPRCATAAALSEATKLADEGADDSAKVEKLLLALRRKERALDRLRGVAAYKSLMEVWLNFHIPLAFALIAALIVHVFSVFFYW